MGSPPTIAEDIPDSGHREETAMRPTRSTAPAGKGADQPGDWQFNWLCRWPFPREGRTHTRLIRVCACRVTLGHDRSWEAEPGGWRGKWGWNAKTRTLSVSESRDGRRWFRWSATFLDPYDGVVYEAAGAPRVSIDATPAPPAHGR
jgi:hypothetical protein